MDNELLFIELFAGIDVVSAKRTLFPANNICIGQWYNQDKTANERASKIWYKDAPKVSYCVHISNSDLIEKLSELGAKFKFHEPQK